MGYKILVVDDSALMRRVICDIINADEAFQVTKTCKDGHEAYDEIKTMQYDAVILDMILPKLQGIELLGKMQQEGIRCPVIAISSALKEDAETIILAMERGAFDFVVKPFGSEQSDKETFKRRILEELHNAVKSKPSIVTSVKKTVPTKELILGQKASQVDKKRPVPTKSVMDKSNTVIALACSTGGPQALHKVIPMLPKNLGVPVVIVQHMPAGFTESLANRLNLKSEVTVKEAEDKEILQPGVVYIAPGGRHMEVMTNRNHQSCIKIHDLPPVNSLRPCADVMYESLIRSSYQRIICVVLTGMGSDGFLGIQALEKSKKVYVVTESQSTCVVYGMPKAVEQAGLANETVPINKIANSIIEKLGV